jgi:predicted DNA-binding transcriptional regulator YafY
MGKDLPGRLLRLLSLLQARRTWSGAELAGRLGVTDRTLRRDVERLRALDYPVQATTGPAGGYRLTSGRNLPPLLLDDDEALATAIALATAAAAGAPTEDAAVRALTKLQRVLPARLRPRLAALIGTTAAVAPRGAAHVDPDVLGTVATCCHDAEILAFDYRGRTDDTSARRVEPHRLVLHAGRWYLVAYDPARADWRTFRVDRMSALRPTRRAFTPRVLPAPDAATFLVRSLARATYRHGARLTVGLPAERVQAGVFATIPGQVDAHAPDACTVALTAESVELVVQFVAAIAALGAPTTMEEASGEVATRVCDLGRVLAGLGPSGLPTRPHAAEDATRWAGQGNDSLT